MDAKKKRFIRDLRSGRRSSISQQVIEKYNWTVEERNFIQPYIIEKSSITNTSDSISSFTKKDAYDVISEHVQNEHTKKNYYSRVNALLKLMNINNEIFSDLFISVRDLSEKIIQQYKDPTSYFAFILYMFGKSDKLHRCVPDNTFKFIQKLFNDYKSKNIVLSLKQRKEDMEYERVYKYIFDTESRLSKEDYASMKHIISLMYTHALYDNNNNIHINPRNYFINVLLVDNDEDMNDKNNFYNTKNGRLLLNDYKTSGIYEPYDVIFSDYTRKVIDDSLKRLPRTRLIEKVGGGLYANNTLSNTIKVLFGGYHVNQIRKGIESYEVNVKNTDRVHLAKVSRHTVITQEVSYLAK